MGLVGHLRWHVLPATGEAVATGRDEDSNWHSSDWG